MMMGTASSVDTRIALSLMKGRKKAEKESKAAQDFIDQLYETVLPTTESSTIMEDDSDPEETQGKDV
jgi:hypothetical protein